MSTFNIVAPKLGESVQELTIAKFHVSLGDMVQEDDVLFDVESDKVDSEIPSPVEGKIIEIKYSEGDLVPVGDVIAVISLDGEAAEVVTETADTPKEATVEVTPATTQQAAATPQDNRFYSPLAKRLAALEGISPEELATIKGNGINGRVQKADILNYLENRGATPQVATPSAPQTATVSSTSVAPDATSTPQPTVSTSQSGNDIIEEMGRVRKIIADRMKESKHTAPHVTAMVEIDVTNLVKWRDANKADFLKREGMKLTFMPMIIEATTKALKDFPRINSHLNGYTVTEKKDINIGVAVATNSGDLMVPVIKNSDHRNLVGIAAEMDRLAQGARTGNISVDDLQGGTFTISNFGSFRNMMGTPIINIPEVAILAVGTIEKKPAVMETEYGDIIVPRSKMILSLSYDHRLIDGMLGGQFLRRLADNLENFDINTTI